MSYTLDWSGIHDATTGELIKYSHLTTIRDNIDLIHDNLACLTDDSGDLSSHLITYEGTNNDGVLSGHLLSVAPGTEVGHDVAYLYGNDSGHDSLVYPGHFEGALDAHKAPYDQTQNDMLAEDCPLHNSGHLDGHYKTHYPSNLKNADGTYYNGAKNPHYTNDKGNWYSDNETTQKNSVNGTVRQGHNSDFNISVWDGYYSLADSEYGGCSTHYTTARSSLT